MAISIDWGNRIIHVPRADMLLVQSVPTEIRELDINVFRLTLKNLEDDEAGMSYPDTHRHNTLVTVGGVTLARVVEIINDYTVTFEDGQYAVNLVGANSNIGDRVNVNQVSVRSANSAGLTQIREIQAASFLGEVALDAVHGTPGTTFPTGTHAQPSNNIIDAKFIAELRGLEVIVVHGAYTLSGTDDVSSITLKGENPITTIVSIQPSANVLNTQFEDMIIHNSTFDGYTYLKHVALSNSSGLDGYLEGCLLSSTITPSASSNTYFVDCKSGCVGIGDADLPVIDLGGLEHHIAFRNYSGPIKFINSTNANTTICLDIVSGAQIILDSSCTAGTMYIRGTTSIQNNSTMTVHTEGQLSKAEISTTIWSKLGADMPVGGIGEWLYKKVLTIPKFIGLK